MDCLLLVWDSVPGERADAKGSVKGLCLMLRVGNEALLHLLLSLSMPNVVTKPQEAK